MSGGVGLALSAASAFMQYRQSQAQAAQYEGMARGLEVQAQYTRFNAKQESLKHKKAAADSLEATLVRMAQINAAAGAGHMDPFSGNPFGLRIQALNVGGTNFATATTNEDLTRLFGEQQAKMQYWQAGRARAAGKSAQSSGIMSAMMTLGLGAYNYYQTSIPNTQNFFGQQTQPGPGGMSTYGMTSPNTFGGAPAGTYFGTGPNYGFNVGKGLIGI